MNSHLAHHGQPVVVLIVDVIGFQKIYGLCRLKGHIVEIWRDVTLVDKRRTVVYHLPLSTLPPLILTILPSVCVNFALYDCQLCPL